MGQTDWNKAGQVPPTCVGHDALAAGGPLPGGTEADGVPPAPPAAEGGDAAAWEAAWIDLGGEG
jgi:hypothetical protein